MNKYVKRLLPVIALIIGILLLIGIVQYDLMTGLLLELVSKLKSGR